MNVPVAIEQREIVGRALALHHTIVSRDELVDAQCFGDGAVLPEMNALFEQNDMAGPGYLAGRRRQLTGEHPEQRRLARAVSADEARAAGRKRETDSVKEEGAVGQTEREAGASEG